MRTGDFARIDHAGLLYIEGRLKDLIIVAGRNIYPQVSDNNERLCFNLVKN